MYNLVTLAESARSDAGVFIFIEGSACNLTEIGLGEVIRNLTFARFTLDEVQYFGWVVRINKATSVEVSHTIRRYDGHGRMVRTELWLGLYGCV